MKAVAHMSGGGDRLIRYPIAATIANAGIPTINITNIVGIRPCTTTSFADTIGLALDTATYSTTQADLDDAGTDATVGVTPPSITGLDMGRMVMVSCRPDLIVEALASGGATESTALVLLVNTAASAGGTVITDADSSANDQVGGLIWCTKGANVGHARTITSDTASTSVTVTVPFPRAIAVNDEFLWVPWNAYGTHGADLDGSGFVQTTTLFTQADATIATGSGGAAMVVDLVLAGRTDTKVHFMFRDHHYNVPS